MAFKTKELAKEYRSRQDVKDKKNAVAKAKYAKDPLYRKQRIQEATDHRKTDLGMVMSRLRINNHYAKKRGYAPCIVKAQDILTKFNGGCDICKEPHVLKDVVIDHDHVTGNFRGWLCGTCNSGIGFFDDDPQKLTFAIAYLYNTKTRSFTLETTKETNPKDLIGSNKVPLSIVPGTTKTYLAIGHLEGHTKYGFFNWRAAGVRLSIYLDAMERHIEKLKGGEWVDPITNVPHIANAITCISIIIDAYECGKLVDDRPVGAPISGVIDRMSENVVHLKKMFGGSRPIDYMHDGPKQREG